MKHSSTISKLPHRDKPTDSSDVQIPSSPSDVLISAGPLNALEYSRFRRLPAEIRREIFAMALKQDDGLIFTASSWQCSRNGTPASKCLSLRGTCRQIYRETEGLVFGINDINLDYLISSESGEMQKRNTQLALGSLDKICKLPSLLPIGTRPRIVTWPVSRHDTWVEADGIHQRTKNETVCIATAAVSLRPFRLFVGCQMDSHRWAASCYPNSEIGRRTLCIRDAPMSIWGSVRIDLVFPVDDQAAHIQDD